MGKGTTGEAGATGGAGATMGAVVASSEERPAAASTTTPLDSPNIGVKPCSESNSRKVEDGE